MREDKDVTKEEASDRVEENKSSGEPYVREEQTGDTVQD